MVERTVFDTRRVAPDQRFAAWRDSIGVLFDVDSAPDAPERFRARVETWMLDGVVFSRCRAGAQAFSRPASRYVQDGIDHYMVQLFLAGGVEMRQGAGSLGRSAGAIVGFDLADVLDSVNHEFDLLNIFIPRRRLAPLLRRPDSLHGAAVDGASGAGLLLADYYRSLYAAADGLSEDEAAAAAEALLRMIAAGFNGACVLPHEPPAWADHAVALKARRFIAGRLEDGDLAPDAIASAIGVSRPRLYRAFAGAGGVHGQIRDQRLRRCLTDLISPRLSHLQVAEIGYRWGFKRADHFSRAFRDRFGVTPGEARARGAAALPACGAGPRAPLDRRYEAWIAAIG